MKKFIILFLLSTLVSYGQENELTNTSCEMASSVCEDYIGTISGDCQTPVTFYYSVNATDTFDLIAGYTQGTGSFSNVSVYGPFMEFTVESCESIHDYTAPTVVSEGNQEGSSFSANGLEAGFYIIAVTTDQCDGSVYIRFGGDASMITCDDNVGCANCVTSFAPTPGQYVVSAWVKEKNASATTTTYENVSLQVSFPGTSVIDILEPVGNIIDGWQQINSLITVPGNATDIEIQLIVDQGVAFFDDIRFHPYDGSMMSYVYDPQSLRLMAELDERNYATLYEYDEEGKLIRVKKETEKGVMTIQENRDNVIKK